MFQRINRDESGFAMVFAVLVVFVVVTLSVTVLSLSIHNSEQSAYDRKRVTSVVAAEAGVDDAWNRIQTMPPESLPCTTLTGSVEAEPGPATFSASYTWYRDSVGSVPLGACPDQSANVPGSVLITSTGRTSNTVPRQVQAFMTLAPNYGGFDAAILSQSTTSFSNNFSVTGNSGSDGDIYITSGNLVVTNAPTFYGNVYVVNGSASLANSSQIVGNLWALNSVTVGSTVTGNVTSSTSSVGGVGFVGGSATAGTSIDAGLTVGGNRYPNTPQGPPPTQAFPKLCQVAISGVCDAMPWTAQGYTVSTYTGASACTSAHNFLTTGTITGDRVVWIDAVCNLSIVNNDDITFTGNLAIVTQGSITMANRNDWNGVSGKSLFLIVNYRTIFPASCSASYNIGTGNNSNFLNAIVLLYSPCTVTLSNSTNFSGQALANSVNVTNQFTMAYKPVLVPGVPSLVGFDQSIVYVREVA